MIENSVARDEPRAPAVSLERGQRLGEWILDAPLGKGGFAEVWSAHHNTFPERRAAVKVPFDRSAASRLRAEGSIQGKLDSPRIAHLIGLDPEHDPPYLAFELVSGESLRDKLGRGRLAPEEALRIAREILLALETAHEAGIVHRDLKPENVLLSTTGEVKVADFGLGTIVDASTRELLASGSLRTSEGHSIVGTIRYMAPEQREPGGAVDARADLYAWGIVLFEALTGEPPCGAEMPSQVVPGLDPRLDQVFRRAYARREGRYKNALEALADLDPIVRSPAHTLEENDPVANQAARTAAPRAGVLARGLALAVDLLPFLWFALETENVRTCLPLFVLYDAVATGAFGTTVGKWLMGVVVRDTDGARIPFSKALLRSVARLLSFATLGVGFFLALGREKLALHDTIVGTKVEHSLPWH